MAATGYATRRVVLFAHSYLGSKRRAGFQHLSTAFWNLGWDVTFVTAPVSLFSRLRRDYRLKYPVLAEANRMVDVRERLTSFVLVTKLHPQNLRSPLANRLATPLYRRYARVPLGSLAELLPEADLVVFESGLVLLLVEQVRRLARRARLVYRPSDDLRWSGLHPLVLEAEADAMRLFDFVCVPTRQIAEALASQGTVHVCPPAVDKAAFDRQTQSPYGGRRPAAVFPGVWRHFDYDTLALAAELAPQVDFHVIGIKPRELASNVRFHLEMPFDHLVPYLQHATFGLLFFPPGYTSLGQGNKVAQYSYCRLPIVAPAHLEPDRPNICVFEAGDPESLERALSEAERMPHLESIAHGIPSAEELAAVLAGDAASEGYP